MTGRRAALGGAWMLLVLGGLVAGAVLPGGAAVTVRPLNEPEMHRLLMALSAAYMATAALPFVPGAEIGLGLLAAFGGRIALLVWGATVLALALAYGAGRLVPPEALARGFEFAGLGRAAGLVRETAALPAEARAGAVIAGAPGRVLPLLLRYRYLALALAINLPGNTLAGGGGGLALAAGMSRLFAPGAFLLTVMLAVAPVPLFFALFR